MEENLTPKQSYVLQVVRSPYARPVFRADLAADLAARLHDNLSSLVQEMGPDERFSVDKYKLAAVLDCEGRYHADLYEPFMWSLANVRGTVAHRAIERLIFGRYGATPLDLVESAIDYFASDEGRKELADFLNSLSDEERHDLVHDVADIVTKYASDWPEIPRAWWPIVESRQKFPLFDGRIVLSGRVDLRLGKSIGNEARVFIADWKSGSEHDTHLQDARFYALVETLARGIPPYRVGSYYLDSGRFVFEDITEDVLEAAIMRVTDGITRMRRIHVDPNSVQLRAGPLCYFCSARDVCDTGMAWTSERESSELP